MQILHFNWLRYYRSISNHHPVAKFAGFVNLFISFYSQINIFFCWIYYCFFLSNSLVDTKTIRPFVLMGCWPVALTGYGSNCSIFFMYHTIENLENRIILFYFYRYLWLTFAGAVEGSTQLTGPWHCSVLSTCIFSWELPSLSFSFSSPPGRCVNSSCSTAHFFFSATEGSWKTEVWHWFSSESKQTMHFVL